MNVLCLLLKLVKAKIDKDLFWPYVSKKGCFCTKWAGISMLQRLEQIGTEINVRTHTSSHSPDV